MLSERYIVLRVASFFAGIGGFDLGLEKAGMRVVFQCEINKFCQSILKKHWPDVPLIEDISEINPKEIPTTDVWCGGFPCQDLSLANQGKRKGLDGERSGLFRIYAELISARKPKWVIIENVPGLLNSHQGKDFQFLLQRMDELGYGVSWRIFDAKYFGTPQRRRRVFIVCSFGSLNSAKVLFEEGTFTIAHRAGIGKRDLTPKKDGEGDNEADLYVIQHASIGRKPEAGPQAKGYRYDGETYTLDSRGSADAICQTTVAFRVREPSGVSEGLDGNRYRAVGNAVCVNIVEWIGKQILKVERQEAESAKGRKSNLKTASK